MGNKVLRLLVDLFVSIVIILKMMICSLFLTGFKLVKHEPGVKWKKISILKLFKVLGWGIIFIDIACYLFIINCPFKLGKMGSWCRREHHRSIFTFGLPCFHMEPGNKNV